MIIKGQRTNYKGTEDCSGEAKPWREEVARIVLVDRALNGGFLAEGAHTLHLKWAISNIQPFYFYWSVVDLQCSGNLCCTAKWLSYTHIDILFLIFFSIMFITGYWVYSLSYRLGPCCLSILNVIVCIYQPQTPRPSISLPASPLATTSS